MASDRSESVDLLAVLRGIAEGRGGRAMDAYYFGFDSTGNEYIDLLLAAIAAAGKGYHSTEMWADDDYNRGWSYIDLIQAAANDAAAHFVSNQQPS